MIGIDYIQKAIIETLRNNQPLMAALGGDINKITENQFQGQDIRFPTIKVDMGPQSPIGNGTDRVKLSNASWSIVVFSEDLGSRQANNLLNLVTQALFNTQITGRNETNNPIFYILRIDVVNSQAAIRITNRLWKAEVFFETTIYPITDDPDIPT